MNRYPEITSEELGQLRGLALQAEGAGKSVRLNPLLLLTLIRGYSKYKSEDYKKTSQARRIKELEKQVLALSSDLNILKMDKE